MRLRPSHSRPPYHRPRAYVQLAVLRVWLPVQHHNRQLERETLRRHPDFLKLRRDLCITSVEVRHRSASARSWSWGEDDEGRDAHVT